jgi:anti-sigma regulatory factor (Ser/Thr protein kinase)
MNKAICINNNLSDIDLITAFLAEYIVLNKISDEIHNELRLVAEETFVNIVSYAFSNTGIHTINIELCCSKNEVSITFTDTGIAFNPLTDYEADLENDDHSEGGMGIPLIKSLTDHQQYNRIAQRNVFTLTKHYTK